ncbi:SRPBCC domain-containing protein [Agrococcus sp. ARC_14]|uniref:SRPBCC family protein n=1 Tax=Agrococcus sp. ARC_14 TaxID=2919927 RepID=UPI001F053F48|nr:SRPBCC domain-containing protein [Agrococcus sp. ARC_14]MCH1882207.1 SRPBCC domain-containing protein [Agrococcus sp. ARC_14]
MTETTIELSQHVQASRELAWAAWTEQDRLARWWWRQVPGTTIRADARVGGAYRFENVDAGFGVTGEYLEVLPLERLVFSWRWIDGGSVGEAVDTVTVTFTEEADGTRVTIEHVTDAAGVADYELGWRDTVAHLEAALA